MNIPFLSLKDVTALHGAEINEAVTRVVNGGWYLQGKENELFEQHYAEFIGTKYCVVPMAWMHLSGYSEPMLN